MSAKKRSEGVGEKGSKMTGKKTPKKSSEKVSKKPEKKNLVLEAKNIYSLYKGKEGAANVVALRGLSLELKRGELVSIVGPSGAGKSTLLRILGGLQEASAGEVYYDDLNIFKVPEAERVDFRRMMVGYVFQEGNLIPTITALENVIQTLRFANLKRSEAKKRAIELMELLEIKDRMNAYPTHLSGGESQRVSIARALANNPSVLLMDEPTGSLDYKNAENVMKIITKLRDRLETACLIVTHSKHIASFTDRSLELLDGRFIGQHGVNMDLTELSEDREVFINTDGTLNLPPELLPMIYSQGELWKVHMEKDDDEIPIIIAKPSTGVKISKAEEIRVKCPVCSKLVNSTEYHCRACGAKLRE